MTNISFKVKNSKKAVTPVIATIILIAATIVLALVVGAYTFGLFGSNVKAITAQSLILTSGAAYSGPSTTACTGANLFMALNNPGGATTISSITLSSGAGVVPESTYYLSGANSCASTALSGFPTGGITGGASGLQVTIYFGTTALTSGVLYSYVINFANGNSLTGQITAQ
jgi:flagellin-like protein